MVEDSTILRGAVTSDRANHKIKYIVAGLAILGLVGYLIYSIVGSMKPGGGGAYYREVGEVLAQQTQLAGKNVRVSGNVIAESVQYDAPNLNLSFMIADPADASQQLAIRFHGVQPDQITRPETSAIIEGQLGPGGVMQANNLLLKCPSRYEEDSEIAVEALK